MKFIPIAKSEDLKEGAGQPFEVEGHRLAVVRHQGKVYALEDYCPHAGATIAFGMVENDCIVCPWHFAEFNLHTGAVLSGPATKGIPVYPVREEDGMILVCLDPSTVAEE